MSRTPSQVATRRTRIAWGKWLLIAAGLGYLGLFLVLPACVIFKEAFQKGWRVFTSTFYDSETQHAVWMSLLSALIAVPVNTVFGVAAAWAIAKFEFPFKRMLLTLIDLPLSVSPVIAGMVLILVYGTHGWFGGTLDTLGLKIIFAKPGVILATMLVTLPFVVRELVPLMQAQGRDEEEAAILLGASGWQVFSRITLPQIKWALFYGVMLCNARAMGEFGAASVVAGNIRGETATLPIQIQMLFDDYRTAESFACATLLASLALISLVVKSVADARTHESQKTSS